MLHNYLTVIRKVWNEQSGLLICSYYRLHWVPNREPNGIAAASFCRSEALPFNQPMSKLGWTFQYMSSNYDSNIVLFF